MELGADAIFHKVLTAEWLCKQIEIRGCIHTLDYFSNYSWEHYDKCKDIPLKCQDIPLKCHYPILLYQLPSNMHIRASPTLASNLNSKTFFLAQVSFYVPFKDFMYTWNAISFNKLILLTITISGRQCVKINRITVALIICLNPPLIFANNYFHDIRSENK